MRWYTNTRGEQRLWIEDAELDELMETELRRSGSLPAAGGTSVNIERVLEKHLKVRLDQHAELPDDVLGQTDFFANGRHEVRINRALTAAVEDEDECPPGVRGRWRATMAHEATHVLLHSRLFVDPAAQGELWGAQGATGSSRTLHRCLRRDVHLDGRGGTDWREVQANKGMAALLMPRTVFIERARAEMQQLGVKEADARPEHPSMGHVVARLASAFETSRQATRIRLQTLGLVHAGDQTSLL